MSGFSVEYIEEKSKQIRRLIMESIWTVGVGHLGGCLSIADLLAVLYFSELRIDSDNPHKKDRDRLVISKGHAGPALYSALALRGYFPVSELHTLNSAGTRLPSHCDMILTVGVDMTAGSLGQGLSCAVGMAYASKLRGYDSNIFAIIGDGESQEGQIWEASMSASQFGLDNLIVFLDYNKLQIDGTVCEIMDLLDPAMKWEAFGFYVQRINGHCVQEIKTAIEKAKAMRGKPSMIVMDTIKGKGVTFVEKAGSDNHNMHVNEQQFLQAQAELA